MCFFPLSTFRLTAPVIMPLAKLNPVQPACSSESLEVWLLPRDHPASSYLFMYKVWIPRIMYNKIPSSRADVSQERNTTFGFNLRTRGDCAESPNNRYIEAG